MEVDSDKGRYKTGDDNDILILATFKMTSPSFVYIELTTSTQVSL